MKKLGVISRGVWNGPLIALPTPLKRIVITYEGEGIYAKEKVDDSHCGGLFYVWYIRQYSA